MMSQQLVSIQVLSYNSETTIVETLESIKNQTYENLELIVSDDCSHDNTVNVVKKWIEDNRRRFIRIELLTSDYNTGVPSNLNRAIAASRGQWFKDIAADDIMLPNSIESCVNYMNLHKGCDILFSRCKLFKVVNGKQIIIGDQPTVENEAIFDKEVGEQLLCMYERNFAPSPTVFYRSSLFEKYCFDEKYPAMEDYPFFIKLLESGVRFSLMDDYTVLYRRGESLSCSSKTFGSEFFHYSYKKFFYNHLYEKLEVCAPELLKRKKTELLITEFKIYALHNKRNPFTRIVGKLFEMFVHTMAI